MRDPNTPHPPRLHTIITLALLGLSAVACLDDQVDELETVEKKPEQTPPPNLLCSDDVCTDDIADTNLLFDVHNFDLHSGMFHPGASLRVFGYEYGCNDSPCSTSWAVVRGLNNGRLIAAYFGKPIPSAASLSGYGETPESWLWPLTVDPGDHGNCQPYDSGCGDGTVLQRGAVDFVGPGETARILDGTHDWAPLGYHANVEDWTLGDASCQYALWSGRANVIRADCDGDCPAPGFAEGCGPTAGPYDSFWVSLPFSDEYGEPNGSFDAICRVVEVLDQKVSLDCAYTDPPY